jgi:biotin transport system substrate-specific component
MKDQVYPSLALALRPQAGVGLQVALVVAGSLLLAVAAQIKIPLWPVPVTAQTLVVLLLGALLGSRLGVAAVLLYLAQGAMGLPVFAGGGGGAAALVGPTAGYLAGFVVAVFLVGKLCERGWDRKVGTAVLAMLLGNLTIYLFGLLWLSRFVGADLVLSTGLLPFIPGDILKIVLAAILLPAGWRMVRRE